MARSTIDGPLIAALVAGAALLVVGVGSVFLSPAAVEVVDDAVPHDLPIARPMPVPAMPPPVDDGLREELLSLDEVVRNLRQEMLASAEAVADPAQLPDLLREGYLKHWELNTIRHELREQLANEAGRGAFLDEARAAVTSVDAETVQALRDFLSGPTPEEAGRLFGAELQLGLAWDLLRTLEPSQRHDPNTWVIGDEDTEFAASTGPYDVWAAAEAALADDHEILVGEHPHCVSGPKPAAVQLDGLRRVSIVTVDHAIGCLSWSSVELFVAEDGRIHAVTIDRWEP